MDREIKTIEDAINVIITGCEIGNKAGAYTLQISGKIIDAIRFIQTSASRDKPQ